MHVQAKEIQGGWFWWPVHVLVTQRPFHSNGLSAFLSLEMLQWEQEHHFKCPSWDSDGLGRLPWNSRVGSETVRAVGGRNRALLLWGESKLRSPFALHPALRGPSKSLYNLSWTQPLRIPLQNQAETRLEPVVPPMPPALYPHHCGLDVAEAPGKAPGSPDKLVCEGVSLHPALPHLGISRECLGSAPYKGTGSYLSLVPSVQLLRDGVENLWMDFGLSSCIDRPKPWLFIQT